ncbi:Dynamin GTPase [Bertholletia excelsa]
MDSQAQVNSEKKCNGDFNVDTKLLYLALEEVNPLQPPLIMSYNKRIRPLLDAIDRLRQLKIAQEGIQLPTIVVVGDQSSGKSSVLESLAGINLPRGQGICTRVPLIMRLHHHASPCPNLRLEFQGKTIHTDDSHIAEDIRDATNQIAGTGKGISNSPLTLIVEKMGVPDLTMVDLPGITRVPVHGQPQDIYEQISAIIMEYIRPEESIILNVLSATVDFPTCESIRMSQGVDKNGERTLAVVTKADKAPEGLLEKVTADDVNIGLGYVCVRNRIGEESYEEARKEETNLFQRHPLLSKIDKSMVGVPVLAQRLVQIQASIISKCLPDIVRKINDKLNENVLELSKMPKNLSSVAEAITVFMGIIGLSKDSLRKIMLRAEFDEYPDDKNMHCTARLAEVLGNFTQKLQRSAEDNSTEDFLLEEIKVLEEIKGIWLPNFLPRQAFLTMLQRKLRKISHLPLDFMGEVWDYIKNVVNAVLMRHSEGYPQLQSSMKRAANNLVEKMKGKAIDRVTEMVEMEKVTDYTYNQEYMEEWGKLMAYRYDFMTVMNDNSKPTILVIEGFGEVETRHLRSYPNNIREQAFDLKMRIAAYWKIVFKRIIDAVALNLLLSVDNLVNREIEKEIANHMIGGQGNGIERRLEESPSVATKRERLKNSIKLLKESKEVVAEIMDRDF